MNRVLRADGRPAYEAAPPRLRQSHVDMDRAMHRRLTLREEVRRIESEAREAGEPSFGFGTTIFLAGLCGVFFACIALWLIFA